MFKKLICNNCGTRDQGKRKAQGSLAGELLVWVLCIILAGYTLFISIGVAVVYSLWRVGSKKPVCGSCGAEAMIDINSPMGQKLRRELGIK